MLTRTKNECSFLAGQREICFLIIIIKIITNIIIMFVFVSLSFDVSSLSFSLQLISHF